MREVQSNSSRIISASIAQVLRQPPSSVSILNRESDVQAIAQLEVKKEALFNYLPQQQ